MGKILIIDKDDLNVPVMLELLKDSDVTHVDSLGKGLDHLNHFAVEVIVLEISLLEKDFGPWHEEFCQKVQIPENKNAKFVVISHKDDPKWAKRVTRAGAFDYIIKPIDRPLFLQKIGLALSGSVQKQVYSFPTQTEVNVAYDGTIEELSEFGLTLKSERPVKEGEILTFYSDIFRVEQRLDILGRCYKVEPHPENRALFLQRFMFVGVNQAVLKQIRTWLRNEYVRKKQQVA